MSKDALDHVRSSDAKKLHGLSANAVAKRGGATKGDLEVFAQKAKAVTESATRALLAPSTDAAKKHSCRGRHSSPKPTQKQVPRV